MVRDMSSGVEPIVTVHENTGDTPQFARYFSRLKLSILNWLRYHNDVFVSVHLLYLEKEFNVHKQFSQLYIFILK